MAPSQPSRHLTTVLFLDIVGSTRVASDLGDARWHTLLASFRREVGHHLHAHHGREENFTGDGILATFPAPEEAVECAVRIARSVQDLGLDVRSGLHTGQVETIQGQLGGVAVHIGARVMALAGDAEVLVTSTTRDLLRGSGVVFGDATTHELRGVSGSWRSCRFARSAPYRRPSRSIHGSPPNGSTRSRRSTGGAGRGRSSA